MMSQDIHYQPCPSDPTLIKVLCSGVAEQEEAKIVMTASVN